MDNSAMAQPVIRTKYFGELPLEENTRIEFPWGLPGFEQRRWFVAIRVPRTDPLVFLQSLEDPELCFVTLAARNAKAGNTKQGACKIQTTQLPVAEGDATVIN